MAVGQPRTGLVFGIAAYLCWGLLPLYWKLLAPAGPLEVLSHRVVWSLILVAIVVTGQRRWHSIRVLLGQRRRLALIAVASVLIAVNWGVYIYGVQSDQVVETSLGYFINPLVTVLLGVFVLRERLRSLQWAAVGIGAVAVAVLTVDYRRVPYLALTLAVTFGLYGLVKKRLGVAAVDGLTLESGALAVPALAYLAVLEWHGFEWHGLEWHGGSATFGHGVGHTTLLVVSGAVTAVPLLLFAGAANRIPLSTIGLLQYLAPILQLVCGVLVFGEPMPPARLAGFALVWLALAIFTWDAVSHARAQARRPDLGAQLAPTHP
jgi:chloramphenicol-sensitive protein RarD